MNYITVVQTYDAFGRVVTKSNPYRPSSESQLLTTYVFDSLGRTKTITTPDGAVTNMTPVNNQLTTSDPAHADRTVITDGLGRLHQVTENPTGLAYVTTYLYDTLDNLLGVAQGSQTNCQIASVSYSRCFAYDFLSRLTSANNPETGTVQYSSYDGNSNLVTKTDARGITTSFNGFDVLDRVATKTYTDSTLCDGSESGVHFL